MTRIFCDFDGTITHRDSIDFLTERFGAGPDYSPENLERMERAEITIFENIGRELATVTVSWEKAEEALRREIELDPTFVPFVEWCRQEDYPLTVVSSGLTPVLDLFIGEFEIPYYAHSVDIRSEGWSYQRIPAHDKEEILRTASGSGEIVFVGDGTSDVSAIPYADRLFAREGQYLERYCRRRRIPFRPFADFDQIRDALEDVLISRPSISSVAHSHGR